MVYVYGGKGMSFFCPHFDAKTDLCMRIGVECVPGRPGCVLVGKVAFMEPAAARVKKRRDGNVAGKEKRIYEK
jgi:hypothetical protein